MSRRAGLLALLALAVLAAAWLTGARRTEGPPLDPESTATDGARAVVELVDAFGDARVVDGVPGPDVGAALVLEDRFGRADAEAVRRWVAGGGTLVVADPDSTFTPAVVGTADGVVDVACEVPGTDAVTRLDVGAGFLLAQPEGSTACTVGGGGAVVVSEALGEGRVVSVGGPDVFTNGNLDEADGAVLAVALLVPQDGAASAFVRPAVAVGAGDEGLVDLVGTPVWAALAQLLVAFLLAATWRARRLGRPVLEPQQVQVESSELTLAVGRMLTRSRRPDRAAAVLRDRARRDLSGPLGLPLDAPADLVVAALAERGGLTPAEAHRAAVAPVTTDDDLVEVAALLARTREEIAHGRPPARV